MERDDELPGLLPPFAEWTVPQIIFGLIVASMCLLPWAFLFVIAWALMSTPQGGGSPGF